VTTRRRGAARRASEIIALGCLLVSLVEPLAAQELVSATSGDARVVSAIRGRFGIVERKLPTYDIVAHDLRGFSAEGGTLRGYFDGPQLQKVSAQFLGETGRATEEFYFANGEPVFVYRVDERYDRPLSGRVVRRVATRYYLSRGETLRRVRVPTSGDDSGDFPWQSDVELRRDGLLLARCARATATDPKECVAPNAVATR
jgi:hypothetical protein